MQDQDGTESSQRTYIRIPVRHHVVWLQCLIKINKYIIHHPPTFDVFLVMVKYIVFFFHYLAELKWITLGFIGLTDVSYHSRLVLALRLWHAPRASAGMIECSVAFFRCLMECVWMCLMDTILLRRGGHKYLLKVCLIFTLFIYLVYKFN